MLPNGEWCIGVSPVEKANVVVFSNRGVKSNGACDSFRLRGLLWCNYFSCCLLVMVVSLLLLLWWSALACYPGAPGTI